MNYTIEELRERINHLDKALLYVILQRMAIMPLVSEVKKRDNLPVYQPDREKKIFNTLEDFSKESGLKKEMLEEIYNTLISESKELENDDLGSYREFFEVFETESDKQELVNLFNASFLRLLEFTSIMECMRKWHMERGKFGNFKEFVATLSNDEINRKYQ